MKDKKHIILGVSASVAIYKACEIIRKLKKDAFGVNVVMTQEAGEFIRPALFQNLSGGKVYQGLFDSPESWEVEHIALAEKANLVLIAPATANIIAKISSGIADDLLTCVVLATKAPVLICPAMNETMYLNKITQENIRKLKGLGYKFIEPKKGNLVCGSQGIGCLADVEDIVKEAKRLVR